MPSRVETVIVGAGQAGLSMSALLRRVGREHRAARAARPAGRWLARSLGQLLPGLAELDRLVSGLRVRRTRPRCLHAPRPDRGPNCRLRRSHRMRPSCSARRSNGSRQQTTRGTRFRLTTSRGQVDADRVIVATGGFHDPKIPPAADRLARRVLSLHAHDFRNETALPPGGVLVVGSGQTGVQLAEELDEAGRRVVLSTGRCGRSPRRYRGKDVFAWLAAVRTLGGHYRRRPPAPPRAPRSAPALCVQPAHVRPRRRPRHEPAPLRGGGHDPRRPVPGLRRRASHVRR